MGAIAAPTGHSGQNPDAPATFPDAYGMIIATNVQPFHFESINANSGKFWLNLPQTETSCPSDVAAQGACPPGTDTVFVGAGGLDTVVPGGQQVYALPNGELQFTSAHSNLIPAGAVSQPFVYVPQPDAQYGTVTTYAFGADGFMACPTQGSIAYQVFINIPNAVVPLGDVTACVPVSPLAVTYTQGTAAAWQYD
ncbi:uncharacterized protein A1O9_00732 [Exophiala aquamarina CBS 119918]|uniref:IgE-binding protein n=1 Tax=Exophiala aquamarina CBS 119918 TaxID=1182545 RepID=A0A072PRS3_9EURO|nr:uncharacterized protein A1O9_00732 [Exophiala aquamarina CBS 119918]KEF62759.1 hypothetical protein A1O9_00732 [Exophiala aquamarina CBS 119918]